MAQLSQVGSLTTSLGWVIAEDPFVLDLALQQACPGAIRKHGREMTASRIVEHLASGDIFSSDPAPLLVTDFNAMAASEQGALSEALPHLYGQLILASDKLDKRRKIYKAAKKALCTFVEVAPLEGEIFTQWLKTDHCFGRLSSRSQTFVAQNLEGRPSEAKDLLDKLRLLDDVSDSAVAQFVVERNQGTIFEMASFAVMGQSAKALSILRQLFADGTQPLQITGTLKWFLTRLCDASVMLHNGVSKERIKQDLRIWHDQDRFFRLADADASLHLARLGLLWNAVAAMKGGTADVIVGVSKLGDTVENRTRSVYVDGALSSPEVIVEKLLMDLK